MKKTTIAITVSLTLSLVLLIGCGSSNNNNSGPSVGKGFGSPNVTHAVDQNGNYLVEEISKDGGYGYSSNNPIMIGGGEELGTANIHKYLELLAGSKGEKITYGRLGNCCRFRTNNEQNNPFTYLDKYLLRYKSVDGETTKTIFINRYDSNTLKIPKGLKRKEEKK